MMNKLFFILFIIGIVSVVECTKVRTDLFSNIGSILDNLLNPSCPTCSTTSSPTDSTTNPANCPNCEICNFTDYVFMECFNTSDICLRLTEERMFFPDYPSPQFIPYPNPHPLGPFPIPPYPCSPPCPPYPCSPNCPPFPPYPCSNCPPFPPYPCSNCPPFPPESTSTTTTTAGTTSPSTTTDVPTTSSTSPSTTTDVPTSSSTSPSTTTDVPTSSTSPECVPFNVTDYINKLCAANETETIGEILQCIGSLPNITELYLKKLADCLIDVGKNINDKIAQKEIICEDIGSIIEAFEKVIICMPEENEEYAKCDSEKETLKIIAFCYD